MPRDPALPEGTDHIITGAGTTGSTGGRMGPGGGGGARTEGMAAPVTTGGGGSSSGFVAGRGGDDTGGNATSDSSGNGVADKLVGQVREQVHSLRSQATDKIRDYSEEGKDRACGTLDEVSEVIEEAARQIDERLGSEYGDYAHRAAGAVHDFADTLRNKNLEDLLDDTRSIVRKSPGIAIATAAVVGFALVRLVKTGLDDVSGRSGVGAEGGGGRTGV
jgi:ElaB/YqjD/DUF883 family membrane-anchored ribosome-binding protein